MKFRRLLVLVVAVLLGTVAVGACGDDDSGNCPVGSEGCPCTTGGACDGTLVCASNLCVRFGADADADADADGSTTACEGGWLDPVTSLCWQDPSSSSTTTWNGAVGYCANLSLAGHGPGSWHLPTISELRSLIRGCPGTVTGGSCGVTDACLGSETCWDASCNACLESAGPGAGGVYWPVVLADPPGAYQDYWSSSPDTDVAGLWWYVNFRTGTVNGWDMSMDYYYARCVRPGP